MTIALHWFRTDLRVADNPGLAAAQASGLPVAGLYIATPAQWDMHDDAPIKRDFWRRNLYELQQSLTALGIPLLKLQVQRYDDIPVLLEKLLPVLRASELHCNLEVPINERKRDEAVATLCQQLGVRVHRHLDHLLFAPQAVMNKSGEPFKVFTPFSKTARALLLAAPVLHSVKPQHVLVLPALPQGLVTALPDFGEAQPQWEEQWPAGETHAHRRMRSFCQQRIADYKEARDLPAVDGTSTLSAYLAAGVLSIRQCWLEATRWHDGNGVFTWQNELLWHDFYKYIMWHYPHVCRHLPWKTDIGHVPWRHDKKEFQQWCEGRTGVPIVDAAMRQLLQTGWMHNRLRMITAMFLSKHLLIDWRWGERWFMQHLVDGDFAANNGGWQWSASTGTDSVPYFRIFNPVTQSQRFDTDGSFLRRLLPELAALDNKSIHDPGLLRPANYPPPMLELAFGRERALQAFKRP